VVRGSWFVVIFPFIWCQDYSTFLGSFCQDFEGLSGGEQLLCL